MVKSKKRKGGGREGCTGARGRRGKRNTMSTKVRRTVYVQKCNGKIRGKNIPGSRKILSGGVMSIKIESNLTKSEQRVKIGRLEANSKGT